MPKFCTRTRGLSDEQNTEFAKDLKAFTKKESEKFSSENQESNMENDK